MRTAFTGRTMGALSATALKLQRSFPPFSRVFLREFGDLTASERHGPDGRRDPRADPVMAGVDMAGDEYYRG